MENETSRPEVLRWLPQDEKTASHGICARLPPYFDLNHLSSPAAVSEYTKSGLSPLASCLLVKAWERMGKTLSRPPPPLPHRSTTAVIRGVSDRLQSWSVNHPLPFSGDLARDAMHPDRLRMLHEREKYNDDTALPCHGQAPPKLTGANVGPVLPKQVPDPGNGSREQASASLRRANSTDPYQTDVPGASPQRCDNPLILPALQDNSALGLQPKNHPAWLPPMSASYIELCSFWKEQHLLSSLFANHTPLDTQGEHLKSRVGPNGTALCLNVPRAEHPRTMVFRLRDAPGFKLLKEWKTNESDRNEKGKYKFSTVAHVIEPTAKNFQVLLRAYAWIRGRKASLWLQWMDSEKRFFSLATPYASQDHEVRPTIDVARVVSRCQSSSTLTVADNWKTGEVRWVERRLLISKDFSKKKKLPRNCYEIENGTRVEKVEVDDIVLPENESMHQQLSEFVLSLDEDDAKDIEANGLMTATLSPNDAPIGECGGIKRAIHEELDSEALELKRQRLDVPDKDVIKPHDAEPQAT